MSRADEILAELIKFPLEERRVLTEKAIESMPLQEMGSWVEGPEFLAQLDRRFGDLEGAVPWEEVRKKLRRSSL